MEQSHLSRPAHDRLQEELKHRSGPLRLEISDRIERARELGDLKENADYDAAKNEQGLNEARVRQLEQMLRDVVIVEASDADEVGPGTITTLLFDGDDDPQEYLIGSIEERSDTYEVLSTSSPLGEALVGKKVDDTASYETPKGATSASRSPPSAPSNSSLPSFRRELLSWNRDNSRRRAGTGQRVPNPPPPGVRMRRTSPVVSSTVTLSGRRSARESSPP